MAPERWPHRRGRYLTMSELTFTTLRQGRLDPGVAPLLRLERLTVKVGIRRVIENLDLELHQNEAILITGPNGSGKSTVLNVIAGLEPARLESGTITLAGEDVTNLPAHERAQRGVAYLKQRDNVFVDLSVEENLRIAVGNDAQTRFRAALPDWAKSLPLRKRAGLLSGGQRQRLAWAMCTLRRSRLLLADEPEAGMSEEPPWPENSTVLVVSHHREHWEALSR